MTPQRALALLLFAGILAMPTGARWPYAALQLALFGWIAASAVRRRWNGNLLVYLVGAAAAWGLLQLAFGTTVYARATLEKTLDWTAWLAAAWLALSVYAAREQALRFSRWLAVFAGALAAAGLVTRYVFQLPYMGPFVYENQYAAFILLGLPPAILVSITARDRVPMAALSALMIGSVVVSGSVAGAALVIAETAVVLLLARYRLQFPWKRLASATAALAALAAMVGLIAGWDVLRTDLERKRPFELRRRLTESTLKMAAERPAFGFGLGTWSTVYPAFASFDDGVFENQAHNDWAQWLAEGGLPFLALMAAMALALAGPAIRSLWGIGLLFVLAHCLIEYHFQQRPAFGCLYFAVAGAVYARRHDQRDCGG
jgi:hypothetical protein